MLTQIARYEPILRLLRTERGSTLLEVGSGSQGIRPFVGDRWAVTSCDRDFSDYGARTDEAAGSYDHLRASVLDLPLEDGTFDVVVAVDLLEHLAPGDRPRALREMARVARRRLIVACPCGLPALDFDRRLARYYRALRRPRPGWLDEHLANGFPEVAEIVAVLAPFGVVEAIGNEHVGAHFAISVLEATPLVWAVSVLTSSALAPAIRGGRATPAPVGFALRLLRGFDREPAYRRIVVLERSVARP